MTTTTFDTNDDRLTTYAFGELDDAGRAEVEQLLATSPELQAELAELQNLAGMLRSELAREPVPTLTPDQRSELAISVTARPATSPLFASSAKPTRRWTPRHWILAGVETSAAIAFMAIVWPFLPSQRTDSIKPLVSSENVFQQHDSSDLSGLTFCDAVVNTKAPASSRTSTQADSETQTNSELADLVSQTISDPPRASDLAPDGGYNIISRDPKPKLDVAGPVDANFENAASGRMSIAAKSALVKSNSGPDNKPKPGPKFMPEEHPATRKKQNFDAGQDTHGTDRSNAARPQDQVTTQDERLTAKESKFNKDGHTSKYFYPRAEGELQGRSGDPSKGSGTETYEAPVENVFLTPAQQPLSTFSIDVDSASYSNVRRFLTQGQLPPAEAVRIEEMVNYFTYDYPRPKEGEPFSVTADAAPCPWQRGHYLARIALQARTIDKAKRPPTNLVFLLDVSGSMQAANKLPLVKQAMTMLAEELNERDRIAIVTYAGDAGVKLASTPGSDQVRIMQSIEALQAGGSTNGAAGINLAYEEALRHFNGEGENRVILCTDGDFNVGVSSDDQLVQLIQQQAKSKVFLSIFGFGMGNLKDAKLEKLADKGNGHYGYIDDLKEARRVFNEELTGTLYTVAKDVKIQLEFNPLTVGAYRLIGYENRALAARDFNDDTKDAGEIGAGHTVTALYEIVPRGLWPKTQAVDPLKYGNASKEPAPADEPVKGNIPAESADDLFTVKLRYKQPTADTSVKTVDYVVDDIAGKKVVPSADFLWAASVASFGMHLKHSQFKGQWTLEDLYETAQGAKGTDANGRRREFLDLIQAAKRLSPPPATEPRTP